MGCTFCFPMHFRLRRVVAFSDTLVVAAAAAAADDDDDDVECDCNDRGTTSQVCDAETSECLCEGSFTGPRCDRCATGFYRFPRCLRMYRSLHVSVVCQLYLSITAFSHMI